MEIKAADVMKLRKMTGAGMMDCKKALIEAEGDFARAQDIIREKGKLIVAKLALSSLFSFLQAYYMPFCAACQLIFPHKRS